MSDPDTAPTLVDLARARAHSADGAGGYVYLSRGETPEAELTFAGLDRRARAVAAEIARTTAPGARALLQYPPGLDFLAAFFGCLYAGVVAVPTPPPAGERDDATATARCRAVVRSCTPELLLSTGDLLDRLPPALRHAGGPARLRTIATDRIGDGAAARWQPVPTGPDDVAYLQYSSGSTGTPKGVVLTHRNVLHNLGLIRGLTGAGPGSTGVFWLPMFHDMGLVSGALMPLFAGGRGVLMSPLAFLQRPYSWLAAISREEQVTSAAPNFAFDLCVQRITDRQKAGLDLSRWRHAIVGAERVRAATLDRFAEAFAPCGFRPETFLPSYGLAETTLLVSGGPAGGRPTVCEADAGALDRNRIAPRAAGGRGPDLVGSGRVRPGLRVVIADPETQQPCPPGHVGEIWVAGDSVAAGYWNAPEETGHTFGRRVGGEPGFVRTGDMGALVGSELVVSGRLKDLIIVDGRNLYPSDLEATAEAAHPALRRGYCAVVPVDDGRRESVVVLAELTARALRTALGDPAGPAARFDHIRTAVRRALSAAHGLPADDVVLLRPGTLPFTSSGKLQHFACRARYQAGGFDGCRVDYTGDTGEVVA